MRSRQQIRSIIENFQPTTHPILVIGDLILDRYINGNVSRISPEAPVPIVNFTRDGQTLGGAANVALNLAQMGFRVEIAGLLGADNEGDELFALLQKSGIGTSGVVRSENIITTTKLRIINDQHQLLRIDFERPMNTYIPEHELLLQYVKILSHSKPDIAVLSDYAKGVLIEPSCRKLIAFLREQNIYIIADPKGNNYKKYLGVSALLPNTHDLQALMETRIVSAEDTITLAKRLKELLNLEYVTVTQGKDGMSVFWGENVYQTRTNAKQVFDVSGAGDTVIALVAVGKAVGLDVEESHLVANIAAGIVVGISGTTPVDRESLLREISVLPVLSRNKIVSVDQAIQIVSIWKAEGKKILFTNGCFDLLHLGHVDYLEKLKYQGDHLIVGLNSDDSVKRLKGDRRPIFSQEERARLLASLFFVDLVIIFEQDTPIYLIETIRPDVIAKGADYTVTEVVGADEVETWGGTVQIIEAVYQKSSTEIINRIKGL